MALVNQAVQSLPKTCRVCGQRYGEEAMFCPIDGAALFRASPSHAPYASSAQPEGLGVKFESEVDPYIGREILGHIQMRELAGTGAMGKVYRALQKGIDRDVAVKILHAELSSSKELVGRFEREAKVASRLAHPNVVQVHLAGQLPDGALYIVMEYLDGVSLQALLAEHEGAPLDIARSLHIALQLCDAVGEAHAHSVVHRDLKPENVMLIRRGEDSDCVKVLDFGIARMNWGEKSMATAAGLIFGTPRYISPEGAQGQIVGPQSDVYALATIVFQLLAGRTPFDGDQAVSLLIQQIHDAPPHLSRYAPTVPPLVTEAVMRNLRKKPHERDSDARSFGFALLEAARGSGFGADVLPAPSGWGARGRDRAMSVTPGPVVALATSSMAIPRSGASDARIPTVSIPKHARASGAKLEQTLDDDDLTSSPFADGTPLGAQTVRTEAAVIFAKQRTSAMSFPASTAALAATPSVRTAPLGLAQSAYGTSRMRTEMGAPLALPLRTPQDEPAVRTDHPSGVVVAAGPIAMQAGVLCIDIRDEGGPASAHRESDVDDAIDESGPGLRSRVWMVIVACFVVGAAGASAAAYRAGYFASRAADPHQLNIPSLVAAGLATDPSALALPADSSEPKPLASMSDHERGPMPVHSAAGSLLPLSNSAAATTPPAARPLRVALVRSVAEPRPGQTVEFSATVTEGDGAPRAIAVNPQFVFGGEGLATRLPARTEGLLYQAALSFFEGGNYTVTFQAAFDGRPAQATLSFHVGVAGEAPKTPKLAPTTVPASTATIKWL